MMLSPLSFLIDELKQNGIATAVPELIQHPDVLAELSYALSPVLHEGKLQPYGFIAIEKKNAPVIKSTCEKLQINLSEARRVADGCYSFSIFKSGQFHGVFIPKYAAYTELQLVQLQQELGAIIGITDTNGVTKLFCDAGLFIHQYRSWQKKPCINQALSNIRRCAPQADPETLKDLLEFCFHDLSPRKIGATLVWCLAEPSPEEWENMRPNFALQEIETQVGSDRSVAVLRHLLTYTDGAVILDAQARAIGVGAQLKYSEASKRLIEARAGTRHTSAQRFSFDFVKGIIFVVSSDGPVTIFSDGMSVTDLEVRFIDETPIEDTEDYSTSEVAISSCSSEVTCQGCKKRLKIQEIESEDLQKQERSLRCPICGHSLHSVTCSNLDVYVIKVLQEAMRLVHQSDASLIIKTVSTSRQLS
ncbi:DNA integrity scanning protein DisA nucleotide-binding domain protein [Oscillatoria sp. FACHB-1407]|uniref:diadenylate cyclase n=1 Tax=Oscillatoria sp. FACHB-1407 TaxID=2692847 RepID=UPI00168A1E75|nr:diadenylate cyclase [Oscillatoria sp. FACHB-1407]MBD2463130.1 DNA integrity scanning protein DisA nucleotide-binding domain protein [Oscillatoria sp. FACHB-1407]